MLGRWLSYLLLPVQWLLALLILFEEWGWEPLQAALARLGRWPGFRWLEGRVRGLPPYAALALFALPALALLPIKLLALWLIGQGRAWLGAGVIVLTKLVGTAIVARLFTLTQPALMRLGWFASGYQRWSDWKAELVARVKASLVWRQSRRLLTNGRQRWQQWRRRQR